MYTREVSSLIIAGQQAETPPAISDQNENTSRKSFIKDGQLVEEESLTFRSLSDVVLEGDRIEVVELGTAPTGAKRNRVTWTMKGGERSVEDEELISGAAALFAGHTFEIAMELPCEVDSARSAALGTMTVAPIVSFGPENVSTASWKVPLVAVLAVPAGQPVVFSADCWSWKGIGAAATQGAASVTPSPKPTDPPVISIVVTDAEADALLKLSQTPEAWANAKMVHRVIELASKIRSYSDYQHLAKRLEELGVYDPSSVQALSSTLIAKAGTEFIVKTVADWIVDVQLQRLQANGHRFPKAVAHSLVATVLNGVTANLAGQIIDQTFLIVNEVVGLVSDTDQLAASLVQQGSVAVETWQQARELEDVGSLQAATALRSLLGNSIATTDRVMEELRNGSVWPVQLDTANRWAVSRRVIFVRQMQIDGRDASRAIEIAKSEAAELDRVNPLLVTRGASYVSFGDSVAKTYGVLGWESPEAPPEPPVSFDSLNWSRIDGCLWTDSADYNKRLELLGQLALGESTPARGCVTVRYLSPKYDADPANCEICNDVHAGIDLRARPEGGKYPLVYAVEDGVIAFKSLDPESGHSTLTIVSADGSHKTLYLHMSQFDVHDGQEVRQGRPLGRAGDIGAPLGPHLHIEVWPSSSPHFSTRKQAISGSACAGSVCTADEIRRFTVDPTSIIAPTSFWAPEDMPKKSDSTPMPLSDTVLRSLIDDYVNNGAYVERVCQAIVSRYFSVKEIDILDKQATESDRLSVLTLIELSVSPKVRDDHSNEAFVCFLGLHIGASAGEIRHLPLEFHFEEQKNGHWTINSSELHSRVDYKPLGRMSVRLRNPLLGNFFLEDRCVQPEQIQHSFEKLCSLVGR